ncbi:MAG: ABC transporter ATP-binding protein [Halanaerobiales bacterium]
MNIVLKCKDLVKSYGKIDAVNYVDLDLEENRIYGLLGRNGAGKTTLLNMIYGNIFKDNGEICVFGEELNKGQTPKNICYVKEEARFFDSVRLAELLDIAAHFYKNWDKEFAGDLLKTFELNPQKKFRKLSRGMKSMVNIIIGLASRAPLTLFDEPTLGLDALMRERFYSILLEDFAENPRTIFISTHLIDEVAKVIEYIYIIDSGKIILENNIDDIRGKALLLSGKREILNELSAGKNVLNRESYGDIEIIAIYDNLSSEERKKAEKNNISIEGISLQKFFAYYVGGVN